jgi:hypothetical protein
MKHEWTPADRYLAAQLQIALGDNPPDTAFQPAPHGICAPPAEHITEDGVAYVPREEYDSAVRMWSIAANDAEHARDQRDRILASLKLATTHHRQAERRFFWAAVTAGVLGALSMFLIVRGLL